MREFLTVVCEWACCQLVYLLARMDPNGSINPYGPGITGMDLIFSQLFDKFSACTNGRFGRIYVRKFLSYAENRHQRRPRTSKIVSVRPDSKGMLYIPISFRMINSCQNMYIKCIS